MKSFPVALLLQGRACLVVGNGREAALRVENLVAVGAQVTVLALAPEDVLLAAARADGVSLERRAVLERDIAEHWLVVLADHDPVARSELGALCNEHRRLFCAIDQPGDNSFQHVAVTRHGPVSISVSTDGRAPALARRLREELHRVLSRALLGDFAESLAEYRASLPPESRRQRLLELMAELHLTGELRLPPLAPASHSKSGVDPPESPGGG